MDNDNESPESWRIISQGVSLVNKLFKSQHSAGENRALTNDEVLRIVELSDIPMDEALLGIYKVTIVLLYHLAGPTPEGMIAFMNRMEDLGM